MTPSETLVAAADLIRDLAAKTVHDCAAESCGGWHDDRGPCGGCCSCRGSCVQEGPEPPAGTWWAALSPTVAPWLESALRSAAVDAEEVGADPYMIGLAGVILGKEPGSLPTSWREDRQVIEAVTRGVDTP